MPFVTVTQEADPTVAPAAPLIRRLEPPLRLKLISPVEAVPKVRVCLLVVPIFPEASSVKALFAETAEILAVGLFPLTPVKANLAEEVAVAPRSRSRVLFP